MTPALNRGELDLKGREPRVVITDLPAIAQPSNNYVDV